MFALRSILRNELKNLNKYHVRQVAKNKNILDHQHVTKLENGPNFELSNKSKIVKQFSTNMKWETDLEKSLEVAEKEHRIAMIVIHKSWCGACRTLKREFNNSNKIVKLGKNFVLVSLCDDQEPSEAMYAPDGAYVPRIVFYHPNGRVMNEITNPTREKEFLYHYNTIDGVLQSMDNALKKL